MTHQKRPISLTTRITLSFLIVLILITFLAVLTGLGIQIRSSQRSIDQNIHTMIRSLSREPLVLETFETGRASDAAMAYLDSIVAYDNNIDYIVLVGMDDLRLYHPDHSLIGQQFQGNDEGPALEGSDFYLTDGKGTREYQRRGFLGMYDYLRPFTEGDGRRLELAAKALTVLLQADPDILRRLDDRRDDLLLELLKCESRELAQIISRRNGSMGMGREKILVCVTKRQEQAPSRSAALGRLKDFLKAGLCYHASAVYSDCLLLLFSEDQVSGSLLDAAFAVLQDCCVRYDLYAGVSFSFGEDSSIPLADKQALKAALFGTGREKKRERISYYEDFMIKDVINAALRLHTPSFYEHPVITKILAYDRECGTRYLDTLRSYLYSFCNMKATALEMKVHYNTVKYRISMIEEISGRDLKDDRDLLRRLLCSLQILDFAREYDRN